MRERRRGVHSRPGEDGRRHGCRKPRAQRRQRPARVVRPSVGARVHQPSICSNVRPGTEIGRERHDAALEAGAQPVARHVQRHRPADAEVCPQQRPRQSHCHGIVHPKRQLDLMRHAAQLRVHRAVASREQQRHERRRRRHDGVPEPRAPSHTRRRRCRFSAGTGRRSPARLGGRERRRGWSPAGSRPPSRSTSRTRVSAASSAPRRCASSSSARSTSRALLAVRKQFAVGFFVQADADRAEEFNRVADRKRAENPADDRPPAAPEIGVRHDRVGHVASRAAAHENLRAGALRAFEQQHGAAGARAPRENRRGQPRGARADHCDIARAAMIDAQA